MKLSKKHIFIGALILGILYFCTHPIVEESSADKLYNDNTEIAGRYNTFGINMHKVKIKDGQFSGEFKISGMGLIWEYDSSETKAIEIPCTFDVKSRKAKLVHILPDDSIVTLIESTRKSPISDGEMVLTLHLEKGLNRIKLLGYKMARVNVGLKTEVGNLTPISFNF